MNFSFLATSLLFACTSSSLLMKAEAEEQGDGEVGSQVNNGTIVEKGTYPFMTYVNNCGASLVAPNVLLSAAHCDSDSFGFETDDGEKVVYVGLHDWYNDTEGVDYEEIAIEEKVPHPKYGGPNLDYDYMMVKLKTNSTFTPVLLDDGSLNLNGRSELTLMGWGRTGYYYDNYCGDKKKYYDDDHDLSYCFPDNLLEGQNLFEPRNKCNEYYDDHYEDEERPDGGWISSRMMCSLEEDLDGINDVFAGKGDSGGPIIHTETQIQVGVVSWGGWDYDSPNVYAYVRNQYKWINSYIEDWNFEPKVCADMNNKGPCNKKGGCSWKKRSGKRWKCMDALTTEECSNWDGKKRPCKKKGCRWKKGSKRCMARWS